MPGRIGTGKAYGFAASKVGIRVNGTARLIFNIEQRMRKTKSALYVTFQTVLLMVEAEAKRLIVSGYYRPAVKTGRLLNSVTHKMLSFSMDEIVGIVGTSVYYSIYVHDGVHKTASEKAYDSMMDNFTSYYKMEPRPFLTDSLENMKEKTNRMFHNAVRRELVGL